MLRTSTRSPLTGMHVRRPGFDRLALGRPAIGIVSSVAALACLGLLMSAPGQAADDAHGVRADQVAQVARTAQRLTPRLDARISCSSRRKGSRRTDHTDHTDQADDIDARSEYADSAEIHLRGDQIDSFRWESSLFRSTTGFECSIDDSDGLQASYLPPAAGDPPGERWRVQLQDGRAARSRRGYDADHGFSCSIRLEKLGDRLNIVPSCPALCGSRENFSALTVHLTTGQCDYEH